MAEFLFEADFKAPTGTDFSENTQRNKTEFIQLKDDQAQEVRENALLGEVAFTKAQIEKLLEQSDTGGLRIYPSFNQKGQPSLQVLAINKQGGDITSQIIVSEDDDFGVPRIPQDIAVADTNPPQLATPENILTEAPIPRPRSIFAPKLSTTSALDSQRIHLMMERQIKTFDDNGIDRESLFPFINTSRSDRRAVSKVTFSTSSLNLVLQKEGVIGVRFHTSKISFPNRPDEVFKTLVMEPVYDSAISDPEDFMVMSALPCPPDCGTGEYS